MNKNEREFMKYHNLEARLVNQRRIINTLLVCPAHTENQSNLCRQVTQFTQFREFSGDFIGAISLFVMLFGGMWALPIIVEVLK
jgi:hypothetical protein